MNKAEQRKNELEHLEVEAQLAIIAQLNMLVGSKDFWHKIRTISSENKSLLTQLLP